MSDDIIQVQILTDIQQSIQNMEAMVQGIQSSTGKMSSSLEEMGNRAKKSTSDTADHFGGMMKTINKIPGVISGVQSAFLQLGSIMAGGKLFKGSIEATEDWALGVNKLSKTLGVTLQSATAYAVAIKQLGISQDSVIGASNKLTMVVAKGGETLDKYGIKIKDVNGNLKPNGDLIVEIANKYSSFNTQQEQNAFLTDIFGRKMGDMQAVIRLTANVMRDAAVKAKELGLEVGPNGVAQARKYEEAMGNFHLVLLSIQNTIGKALMPVLDGLGDFLGSKGPSLASTFAGSIQMISRIFLVLKMIIEDITIIDTAMFTAMIVSARTTAEVLYDISTQQFGKALAAAKQGFKEIKNEYDAAADGIKQSWNDMEEAGAKLLTPAVDKGNKLPGGSGDSPFPDPGKPKENSYAKDMAALKEKSVELDKQALEATNQLSIADKAKYDIDKLNYGLQQELAAIQEKEVKGSLTQAQAASLSAQARSNNLKEQAIVLQKAQNDAVAEHDKAVQQEQTSLEEEQAWEKSYLERSLQDQLNYNLQDIQNERDTAKMKLEDSKITLLESLRLEKDFSDREYKTKKAALEERLTLLENDPEAQRRVYAELELMAKKHAQVMAGIENSITKQESGAKGGIKDAMMSYVNQMQNVYDRWKSAAASTAQSIESLFTSSFKSILTTGKITSEGIKGFFLSMGDIFAQMVSQMLAQWVMGKMSELILGKTTATSQAASAAALYAVNAMSSVAAIPMVGWAMAPGVGAEAYATGMGFAAMASAAGGWDEVDRDQYARIHKKEMVLSAPLAEKVRNMADQPAMNPSINISCFDSMDLRRYLGTNKAQDAISTSIKDAYRKGFR